MKIGVFTMTGCRLVYKTVISLLRIIAHSLSNQLDLGTASPRRLTQTLLYDFIFRGMIKHLFILGQPLMTNPRNNSTHAFYWSGETDSHWLEMRSSIQECDWFKTSVSFLSPPQHWQRLMRASSLWLPMPHVDSSARKSSSPQMFIPTTMGRGVANSVPFISFLKLGHFVYFLVLMNFLSLWRGGQFTWEEIAIQRVLSQV